VSDQFDAEPGRSTTERVDIGADRSSGLWYRLVLRVSQWYSFLILGRDMGPGLGAVSMDLTDQNLRYSVPDDDPRPELLGTARDFVYDSSPSETLGRINRWSAALQAKVVSGDSKIPSQTVLTTYGLVAFSAGIRLAVIHYLKPAAIFRMRRRPADIVIDENDFPVVIRPASFVPMSSRVKLQHFTPPMKGNIWLKVSHRKSTKLGYLTAYHAVKRAKIGSTVQPPTYRLPPPGILTHRSKVMDSVVVRTHYDSGSNFRPVRVSTVIGFKPVRLITGDREINAQVVEHDGHIHGVIRRSEGRLEPPGHAIIVLNRELSRGHSGCMVLDCEFEQFDLPAVPYAMYIGSWSGPIQGLGYCQLLDQARRHWNLEFCEPWEEENERKPRIS
jgi:hypothetical protein